MIFLSTPSARRATPPARFLSGRTRISIHALREEGDLSFVLITRCKMYFYPRPPRGGRPSLPASTPRTKCISIHALREEGDRCYNIRPASSDRFLSTPSARRATCQRLPGVHDFKISIHALREEGDPAMLIAYSPPGNFYPRPPRGGRLIPALIGYDAHYFYPRPPRGGRLRSHHKGRGSL